jgi:hypothetical protein
MTTPAPVGKLVWAQAETYDAVDDRTLIRALARDRVGTLAAVDAVAGSGLQVILRGGWVAVASCDDATSAVVGSREDHVVMANAGPASGSREDWLWCETHPDEGTWELKILPATQAALLPGIQIATITVPQGANLASQMTIIPTIAELDRRLLSWTARNYEIGQGGWNYQNYGQAAPLSVESYPCVMRPGQWYRIKFVMLGPDVVSGPSRIHAIGVGWRLAGQQQNQMVMARAHACSYPPNTVNPATESQPNWQMCEWTFRYPSTSAPVSRIFDGRYWIIGNGLFRMCNLPNVGDHAVLTVEDVGS